MWGAVREIPGARYCWAYVKKLWFLWHVNKVRPQAILAANYLLPVHRDNAVPIIYDVSFVRMPRLHPAGRVEAMKGIKIVARSAPAIVTISEFTKREVVEVFGVPAGKIFVAA